MKKLILGLLLLMSIFVSADEEYNDNGVLNMDEFLLVDQLTLNDFDEVYLYQETELSDEVYFFEMNIFQDYWEYDEETEKEIVYVVPARLQFIFECNIFFFLLLK